MPGHILPASCSLCIFHSIAKYRKHPRASAFSSQFSCRAGQAMPPPSRAQNATDGGECRRPPSAPYKIERHTTGNWEARLRRFPPGKGFPLFCPPSRLNSPCAPVRAIVLPRQTIRSPFRRKPVRRPPRSPCAAPRFREPSGLSLSPKPPNPVSPPRGGSNPYRNRYPITAEGFPCGGRMPPPVAPSSSASFSGKNDTGGLPTPCPSRSAKYNRANRNICPRCPPKGSCL